MENSEIIKFALSFRRGILGKDRSSEMCFAVCAPLQSLLSAFGCESELTEGVIGQWQHYWLTLPDGRILDPTADQFETATGEPMPKVFLGAKPNWYLELI